MLWRVNREKKLRAQKPNLHRNLRQDKGAQVAKLGSTVSPRAITLLARIAANSITHGKQISLSKRLSLRSGFRLRKSVFAFNFAQVRAREILRTWAA
jgi:hypothetical protein